MKTDFEDNSELSALLQDISRLICENRKFLESVSDENHDFETPEQAADFEAMPAE